MKSRGVRLYTSICVAFAWGVGGMACQAEEAPAPKAATESPAKAETEAEKPKAAPAKAAPVVADTAPAEPTPAPSDAQPMGENEPNERGVTLAACRIVCGHALRLALQEFPPEADAKLRQEHKDKVAKECPPGCMREATTASNNCALKATSIAELVACQK